MDAYDSLTNRLITGLFDEAQSLYSEINDGALLVLNGLSQAQPNAIATSLGRYLTAMRPVMNEHLTDGMVSSWIVGMHQVERMFPDWLAQEFMTGIRSDRNPPPPSDVFNFLESEDYKRKPSLSIVNNAINRLVERNILTREQWDIATAAAQQNAFMITGDMISDTIDKVRNELVLDLQEGTSLGGFQARAGDILQSSGLSDNRIETIYRTNVQSAFRDGRETIARDPLVMEAFPYQAYLAIHDARVRSHHLELESLGLSGTNVYRRDDPFWDYWTPPNGFNCRCGVRLMTVEAAARAGVEEAIRWLETGRPPANPEFRLQYVPFQPEEGFGFRGRFGSMVA